MRLFGAGEHHDDDARRRNLALEAGRRTNSRIAPAKSLNGRPGPLRILLVLLGIVDLDFNDDVALLVAHVGLPFSPGRRRRRIIVVTEAINASGSSEPPAMMKA